MAERNWKPRGTRLNLNGKHIGNVQIKALKDLDNAFDELRNAAEKGSYSAFQDANFAYGAASREAENVGIHTSIYNDRASLIRDAMEIKRETSNYGRE